MTDGRSTLVVHFSFRLSSFLLLRIIIITLHSMHVATIRVDIWWMVLVTTTEKHISALPLSLNFSRPASVAQTVVEIRTVV